MPIWGSRDTRSRAGGFVGLRIRRDSGKVRAARASRHAGTPVHGHTAGGAQREAASGAQISHVRLIERRYEVSLYTCFSTFACRAASLVVVLEARAFKSTFKIK